MDPSYHLQDCDQMTVSELAREEDRWQKGILGMSQEIELLTHENIQLKEEHIATDLQCINMLNEMARKEKELDHLKTEVSRLKNEIMSIKTATNISPEDLLEKVNCLTSELKLSRDDYSQLLDEHADCPTPQDIESIVAEVKASYQDKLATMDEKLDSKDRQIENLEETIAKKDIELQFMAEQLIHFNADDPENNLREERRIEEMETVVKDRERLIGKMRGLLARKSIKINLLLLRIQELEARLSTCRRGMKIKKSSDHTPNSPMERGDSPIDLHLTESNAAQPIPSRHFKFCSGDQGSEDDGFPPTSDTSAGCSELAYPTENDTIYLMNWLEKMREKLRTKSEKEIQKIDELTNQIYTNRHEFDQTQLEIERIRKYEENDHDSREQIRKLVLHEKTLSDSMETTEKQRSRTLSKISSLGKALKNMESLGKLLQSESNK